MKVSLCQINPTVGDFNGNFERIKRCIEVGKRRGARLIVFPELAVTGYFPRDLLLRKGFVEKSMQTLDMISEGSKGIFVVVGLVRKEGKRILNSAAVVHDKKIVGFYDKRNLPEYGVFEEKRYFNRGKNDGVFTAGKLKIGISICEDMWIKRPVPLKQKHADVLINISASPFWAGKVEERVGAARRIVRATGKPFIYVNMVGANDEVVFDGRSFIMDKDGEIAAMCNGFEEDLRVVDVFGKKKTADYRVDEREDIYRSIVLGIRDYFRKNGFKRAVVGVSGGIDSTLTLYFLIKALGKKNVIPVFLPSKFTSEESFECVKSIERRFGIHVKRIPIDSILNAFKKAKTFRRKEKLTIQNLQARIRASLLLAFANSEDALLVACSNKSEIATGYFTLYGDATGAIAPLGDLKKSEVYMLARFVNEREGAIPESIIKRKPSAELWKGQFDENELGNYTLVDSVVEEYVEKMESKDAVEKKFGKGTGKILRMMEKNEFKRRQVPICIKVSGRSFGREWKMPVTKKF